MRSTSRTVGALGLAVALGLAAAGCSGSTAGDRTGSDTLVLRLASIDPVNDNGKSYGPQAFIDGLRDVSHNRIKVDFSQPYEDGAPDAESSLVRAIARGRVDGGWPSTRAFARAGIDGLKVVEAPMTLTSYAAEKDLVSGPMATQLLGRLQGSGVTGLGLTIGPLRRPFAATQPLLGPQDWTGATFRIYNSPVQADAVKALGGAPANLGLTWIDAVRSGELRGAEADIPGYLKNGYGREAGNVTSNVVLWPKVFVLSLSTKRWRSLTDRQQAWVREAAQRAVKASAAASYDETAAAGALCAQGVKLRAASPQQVAALRSRLQPVIAALGRDPDNAALLQGIQAIAARHPDPDVPRVPAGCASGTAVAGAVAAVPDARSALPDGVYRTSVTPDDVAAKGISDAGHPTGTWTLKIADGTYTLYCQVDGSPGEACGGENTNVPLEAGEVHGRAHTAYFVFDPVRLAKLTDCQMPISSTVSGHCLPTFVYRLTWQLHGRSLVFRGSLGDGGVDQYLVNPWRKIT